MDFKGIKAGDVLHGFEVTRVFGHNTQAKAHIKCIVCGHERAWTINVLYHGEASCHKCKQLKTWQDERIGLEFGLLTVKDVRVNHTLNTYVACECGNAEWYKFGIVRRMLSCGCAVKALSERINVTVEDIEAIYKYDRIAGTVTEILTGKDITTRTIRVKGYSYEIKRICWFLGHKELPRYKVTGKSLKLCDLESKYRKKEKKAIFKGDALHSRKTGICRSNGQCVHYRECGDDLFECSCLGFESDSEDWVSRSVERSMV